MARRVSLAEQERTLEEQVLELSDADHNKLDKLVNAVLNGYRNGTLSQLDARADLVHIVAAAAKDNHDGVVNFSEVRLDEIEGAVRAADSRTAAYIIDVAVSDPATKDEIFRGSRCIVCDHTHSDGITGRYVVRLDNAGELVCERLPSGGHSAGA